MQFIHGDCLQELKNLPDNSVDSIVTDPPYGLSFMGKHWDYDVPQKEVWIEALRVLKPGGHLLSFFGTRTYHRGVVAIEDAGFEIRDQIGWVYGSGFPKSLNIGKAVSKEMGEDVKIGKAFVTAGEYGGRNLRNPEKISDREQFKHNPTTPEGKKWKGWGTALKPAWEPIVVARKPLDGTVANNVLRWNVGGLNIDACRVTPQDTNKKDIGCSHGMRATNDVISSSTEPSGNKQTEQFPVDMSSTISTETSQTIGSKTLVSNDEVSIQDTTKENTQLENKSLRQDADNSELAMSEGSKTQSGTNFGEEKNALGRWPANLLHDGSEEVVGLFPASSGGAFPKKINGTSPIAFRGDEEREERIEMKDSGSAARFFYCAKANKKDRDEGLEGFEVAKRTGKMMHNANNTSDEPSAGFERFKPAEMRNHHPTVKPTDLMRYLCRLVTPKGGTVLDPFMGSGSTGKAAKLEGFNFIGIEREEEYVKIAEARINGTEQDKQDKMW